MLHSQDSCGGNWDALWRNALRDHHHAGLIWNESTRAELREALQVRLAPISTLVLTLAPLLTQTPTRTLLCVFVLPACCIKPMPGLPLMSQSPRMDPCWDKPCGLAVQTEEATLRLGRSRVAAGSGGRPTWNHAEFAVQYRSLANHLCIGGVYVRLLLDGPTKVSANNHGP